jgi:serine/threonine protein kinase
LDRKKVIEKNQVDYVKNEHSILKMVGNEHVIKCFYTFQNERFLFFVLEFMVGGDLGSLLQWAGSFFEEDAKFYLSQIVAALEYMHNKKIVHRDLKPDNLLIGADGNIKLSDFGLSEAGLIKKYNQPSIRRKTHTNLSSPEEKNRLYINSMTTISDEKINYDPQINIEESPHYFKRLLTSPPKQIIGTPNYLAPEVIDGKDISFAIDWWSLGIMTFQMLTGYLPFQGNTVNEIFSNIVNRKISLPRIGTKENNISVEAYDLINRLLDINPATRLGAAGPQEVKNHPFFKGVNWKNIKNGKPPQIPDISEESDTKFFDQSKASFSIEEFVRENYDDEQNDWKIKAGEAFGDFNSTIIDSVADLNIQCAQKLIQKGCSNSK